MRNKQPLRLGQSRAKQPLRLSNASKPAQRAAQLSPRAKTEPLRLIKQSKALRLTTQPLRLRGQACAQAKATIPTLPNGAGQRQATAEDAKKFCAYMNSDQARSERKKLWAELTPQLLGKLNGRVMGLPVEMLGQYLAHSEAKQPSK